MGKALNGKELGKGITQRKDKLYQARYINRFGKRVTLYGKTLSEITKKLREAQYNDEQQSNLINTGMTLDEWYERWITTCKQHCRNTTLRSYAICYNRLRAELGWRKLSSLNLIVLQEAFNHLKTDASRSDSKAVLVDMLNRAVESDLLVKNVAYGIKTVLLDENSEEKRILSDSEIEILLKEKKGCSLQNFLILGLETGMRMGEILGLTWDCIDFDKGIIDVKQTLIYLPNKGNAIYEFHKPKTRKGKRSIPMTLKAKEALLEQRKWKSHVEIRHNPRPGMEDLVFCSKTNNPIHETNVRKAINYVVDKINRENSDTNFETFTPHTLRHTFASKCIKNGMRPKSLQTILGHASLQMTMDLYCHVEESTLKEEMSLMGEMV